MTLDDEIRDHSTNVLIFFVIFFNALSIFFAQTLPLESK